MEKIGITAEQAAKNVQNSQAGIKEARARLTNEIKIASTGLGKKSSIPVNKLQISAQQAEDLVRELRDGGFKVELKENDPFYMFEVEWA